MTQWKSVEETEACLEALPCLDSLSRLYCLRRFFLSAVYGSNYQADPEFAKIIKLTDAGRDAIDKCFNPAGYPPADVCLAVLGHFFHHEILVDWQATDQGAIQNLLSDALLSGQIRFPYRYGRLLYDRFNDRPDTGRTDHLQNDEAWAFLEGTPIGVYQHGNIVSGPLGLLESLEPRWIPLSLHLPLWHCSDTGCNKLHTVRLLPPQIATVRAYGLLEDYFDERYG
jgi:hypothetical protein